MVLGNPAKRLHEILIAFESASGPNVSVLTCWQTALGCDAEQLPACFHSALSLIPDIRARIESQGLGSQQPVVKRYEESWLRPFMPDRGWQSHSHGLVDNDSLLALTSLSEIFAALDPTPAIVDAHQSQTLLSVLDEAISAVREEGDLPLDLRTVIMDRLYDVQWAVEHYSLHGPEGLQAALDRLGAELARTSHRRGAWRRTVGRALLCGWLLFSHADDFVANLEASSTIVSEVLDWTQEARDLMGPDRLELPSGASHESGENEISEVVDAELIEEDER